MSVNIHCLRLGRYSKNTAVSSTRFPPAPNALRHTNVPRTSQFGLAPATIAKTLHISRLQLNATFRPMMSAPSPQNSAPTNMPTYTAMTSPFLYAGVNSICAWRLMTAWRRRIKESTA